MKIEGTFSTPASVATLRAMFRSTEELTKVPTLRDVERLSPEVLTMVFTPRLALGPVPLATTVTTVSDAERLIELAVVGARGNQSIAVDLAVAFGTNGSGTTVSWTADVVVRGGVASVGQRVMGDLAAKAIGDVLESSAQVAATGDRA